MEQQAIMQYQEHTEIKRRMRAAGVTTRDLANVLQEPPGTVGGRLNGYCPMDEDKKSKILAAIEEAEREQAKAA